MADIIRNKRMRSEMVRLRLCIRHKAYPTQVPETTTSGWGELHKTVRTADINKVDDCRDDIDTLLVFVRELFSCAMSAYSFALS